MYIKLEDLEVYQLSENIADQVWDICLSWDHFAKDTVGKQLVKAADSIGAHIAESFGRFSFKENLQFCYYARGQYFETRHFLRRASKRKLLTKEQANELKKVFNPFNLKLNAYIKSMKQQVGKS